MRVLGIETSCDETGVAIYDSQKGLLGHKLYSQVALHAEYGGVVPELASRDHVQRVIPLIEDLLLQSHVDKKEIDGIAYTAGPGLVGALMVGAAIAQSIGFAWKVPTVAVHHMEGHLLAPMLEQNPPDFPFIALLVSGGHTQLVKVGALGDYTILGESLDDAAGEAFDKTAKLLGLGYPGGAALAALAEQGQKGRFHFPRPMVDRPGLDFSFSGLKTHAVNTVNQILAKRQILDDQTRADIACAFQDAIIETLVIKCRRALRLTHGNRLVVAGGVGANLHLRTKLTDMAAKENASVFFPRHEFCTDNGAMIAYAGCQHLLRGEKGDWAIKVCPRWSFIKSSPPPL